MKIVSIWVLVALVIFTLPSFVPGIQVETFGTAMLVAFFFAILNTIVKPIILLVAFPITLITLGLFSFVVNAGFFWLIGSFIKGFSVSGFVPALLGSLVVSVATSVAGILLSKADK